MKKLGLFLLLAPLATGCFLADYAKVGEATSSSGDPAAGGGGATSADGSTGATTAMGGATIGATTATTGSSTSTSTTTSSGLTGSTSTGSTGNGGSAAVCEPAASPPANDPCLGKPGPAMVHVPKEAGGSYCIDATEVTNTDYAAFLGSSYKPASQPAHCTWNTDFTPMGWSGVPKGQEKMPVVNVDWCDAASFCAYAGKRLCGDVSGSHAKYDTMTADPKGDQWYRACSAAGKDMFPYDPTSYDDKKCNGSDYGAGAAIPVAQAASCQGGFCGLYDMAGNVAEWIDACEGYTDQTENCFAVGGTFLDSSTSVSCLALSTGTRDVQAGNLGFRCCLDVP